MFWVKEEHQALSLRVRGGSFLDINFILILFAKSPERFLLSA
jgi:hypothetical protein